ncbi:hypothetical protein [Nocardia sp. CNY236]|uniref:hypothetical protein n=1 Tax=Nocardia sp. CNY236 TaxID=1169152 RepID=UPI00041BCBF9|nr:hypothetical protein [Nocardia sp. CNY236]
MAIPSSSDPDRVPVPYRLFAARRARGLVVPYITVSHRDPARPVWGMLDPVRAHQVLWGKRCQICGQPLTDPFVVFIRSLDYQRGLAVEPGIHPECGHYSRRACPMLNGHQHHYHANPAVRFAHCDDPHCECRHWQPHDPDPRESARDGLPAESWYEAWLHIDDYQVVEDPGSETAAPATGINLKGVRFRRIRKIRDSAAPDTGARAPEVLDLLIATQALFGY